MQTQTPKKPSYDPTQVYTRKFLKYTQDSVKHANISLEDALQQAKVIELECRATFDEQQKTTQWETYLWSALQYGLWRWALGTQIGALRIPRRRAHELRTTSAGIGFQYFEEHSASEKHSPERRVVQTTIRERMRSHVSTEERENAFAVLLQEQTYADITTDPQEQRRLRRAVSKLRADLRADPVLADLSKH